MTRTPIKSWLLPGGALLTLATILADTSLLSWLAPSLSFFYFAVFAAGLLLAWRFNSSRVFFSLLSMLLAHRAVEFFSGGRPGNGLGYIALIVVSLILPLNVVILAQIRERGFAMEGIVPRFGLLFIESVLVAALCRPETIAMLTAPREARPPFWILAYFVVAMSALGVRFFQSSKPVDSGSIWFLAAILAWLYFPIGSAAELYVATAGLILGVSLIETSYVLAYNDELTGIPGRRAFNEALLSLGQQYAIAIVDIDHFKKFNDSFGHDIGDQVLRMVASRLAASDTGGQAYRCGGEEFAIIFRNMSAKDGFEKLDSLRQAIADANFRVRGFERRKVARSQSERRKPAKRKAAAVRTVTETDELSVTVSMGVAEPGTRFREPEQVIAAADQALYSAKRNGRNRVELASGATPSAYKQKKAAGS